MTPAEYRMYGQALAAAERVARELSSQQSTSIQIVLARARKTSIAALQHLIDANPDDVGEIRRLQTEAGLFQRIAEFIRDAVKAGDEAAQLLNEVDKAELANLVLDDEGVSDT